MTLMEVKETNTHEMRTLFAVLYVMLVTLLQGCDSDDGYIEISRYPDGKDFSFTITDDPDYGWYEQKVVVYDLLERLGFRTTIPVWVLDNKHGTGVNNSYSGVGGITTNDKQYLEHTQMLQSKGFEIALHTVGPGNDLREETISGYEIFKKRFGKYPKININHTTNVENIYWGGDRFSNPVMAFVYDKISPGSSGHIEESDYFWGDISKDKTKYIRGWATDSINTLSVNKSMPYHQEDKPYVNYWFGCSDGFEYEKFMRLISDENVETLRAERGTSIIYTHFGYGFVDRKTNRISQDFVEQMTKVSRLDGWFVPVSDILDRFLLMRNVEVVSKDGVYLVLNLNGKAVEGLTIITDQDRLYRYNTDEWLYSNEDGEIILGDMAPYSTIKLARNDDHEKDPGPGILERSHIVWSWLIGR